MKSLLESVEFVEFQKILTSEINNRLVQFIAQRNTDIFGAAEMARLVISLPYRLVKSDEVKKNTLASLADLKTGVLRASLEKEIEKA